MRNAFILAASAGAAVLAGATSAGAHAVVGNRFFPATLATDDPGVADELSLPTIALSRTGDDPAARQLDVSGEWSKRFTDRFGISFGETWTRLKTPGASADNGFQNLETTLKYQVLKDAEHEAITAVGLSYEWAGTGAARVGAEHHSTITPTVFFGKGAGDLPDGLAWARPFAVTGLVGYAIPSRAHDGGERNPRAVEWGLALEYSLPYLAAHVKDYGLLRWVNGLTPLVEASFESPVGRGAGRTTGTIDPGVIWSGARYSLGAEATVPVNRASGRGVGLLFQVHVFIDDLFPRSLGRPIW